jgi:hypothetical protein
MSNSPSVKIKSRIINSSKVLQPEDIEAAHEDSEDDQVELNETNLHLSFIDQNCYAHKREIKKSILNKSCLKFVSFNYQQLSKIPE